MSQNQTRRELSSRKVNAFQKFAKFLVTLGLTPNQISILSMLFAIIGGGALSQLQNTENFYIFLLIGFIGIQLRLLCNLVDGLMAIEGGLKTPTGELFNDVPDRFSDLFLFFGLSLSIQSWWGPHLGWATSVAAILTAYVRTLGASMGQGHDFKGPLAKQHRMAVMNLTLILSGTEQLIFQHYNYSLITGFIILFVGSSVTVFTRLYRISKKINDSAPQK